MKLNTTTEQNGNVCYWKDEQHPEQYNNFRLPAGEDNRRNADDIPSIEVANAAVDILSTQIGMPEEDLIRETAKLFQYGRVGGNVAAAMRQGIQEAIHQQKVKREQGRIIIDK